MLAALSAIGDVLVATVSSSERALPAADLAERARPYFDRIEPIEDPAEALATPGPPASPSWSPVPFTSWPISPRMRACDGERWRKVDRLRVRGARPGRDRGDRVSCGVRNRKNPSVTASTFSGIHDFFASGTWQVIRNLLFFFLIAFWLAVGYWVYKDAKRRIEDPVLIATAVAIGLDDPLHRRARVHALPAARVSRGRARARARDQGDGGAAVPARSLLPGLPRGGLERVPRLPGLHDEAEAGLRELQGAARGALAGVPVLRDAGRAGRRSTSRPSRYDRRDDGDAPSRLRRRWRSNAHSS